MGAVVKDAEQSGFPNVFGVVDSDFGPSNRIEWMNPNKTFRRFVLPVHEIENYLLNSAALAASRLNNRNRSDADIEGFLLEAATQQTWWVACCTVVAELKRRFRGPFNVRLGVVSTEQQAIDQLSGLLARLAPECGRTTKGEVLNLLQAEYANATGQLADGSWRQRFAGKAIFHHAESKLCDRVKPPGKGKQSSHAIYIDLAKDVAAKQVDEKLIPPDLVELLSALKDRIRRADGGPP